MRSPAEIAEKTAKAIRAIYLRPLAYGRHADVERVLIHYHWFWAVVNDRDDEWHTLWLNAYLREHANAGVWSRHRDRNPDLTDDEVLAYTLDVWRDLSRAIDVPLCD